MSDDSSQLDQRKRLEVIRDSLKVFLTSDLHTQFVNDTKQTLSQVEERLLDDPIDTINDAFRVAELKGQRTVLRSNIILFEDTLSTLEARIESMLDDENETRAKQEST